MTKYDRHFKLKVAREGAAGTLPIRSLAGRHGLDPSMVHRWIAAYRHHGQDSFLVVSKRYTDRFKASVLARMSRDGLSVRQAMALFGIAGPGVIPRWQRQYHLGGIGALTPTRDQFRMRKKPATPKPAKDLTHDQLLKEVEYLRAENAFLKKLDALIQEEQAAKRASQRKPSKD
jgi:transposase